MEKVFKNIEDKLTELIDSGEFDKYMKKQKKYTKILKKRSKRLYRIIKNMNKEELNTFFTDFLIWETKYEDYYYNEKNTSTTSNLFHLVEIIFADKGKRLKQKKIDKEMFLVEAFKFRGYTLKTYCGQGCFNRIIYKKENIFQTT